MAATRLISRRCASVPYCFPPAKSSETDARHFFGPQTDYGDTLNLQDNLGDARGVNESLGIAGNHWQLTAWPAAY